MNPRRVVVTGLGALTPIGNSVSEYWEGLIDGKVVLLQLLILTHRIFKQRFACELKNFDVLDFIEKKEIRDRINFHNMLLSAPKRQLMIQVL